MELLIKKCVSGSVQRSAVYRFEVIFGGVLSKPSCSRSAILRFRRACAVEVVERKLMPSRGFSCYLHRCFTLLKEKKTRSLLCPYKVGGNVRLPKFHLRRTLNQSFVYLSIISFRRQRSIIRLLRF